MVMLGEAIFEAIISHAPDGIVLVDGSGRITLANDQACELFEYSREEMIGEPVEMLVPLARRDSHEGLRSGFQESPHVRPMGEGQELYGRRKDGSEFAVEISLAPVADEEHVPALTVAVVRDVSTRNELEEERRDLVSAAQRQIERDRVARDLHDDIIQSIYAVGLSLQVLRRDSSLSRDQLVQRVILELNGVISDIRAYMRELTSGEVDANPAGMLGARIEELVAGSQRPRWSVSVSMTEPPDLSLGRQLHRLAKELVSNVQRHSQAENASLSLTSDGERIAMEVVDDGIGFDPAEVGGSSFGLRSIRERVADLGGDLEIAPRTPRGTSVSINIPVRTGDAV